MPDFLCFLWRGVLMILIIAAYIFIEMAYSEINKKGAGVCSVPFYVLCFYISVNGAVSSDLQFSGKPIWTNEILSEYSSITASSSVTNSFQRLGFGDNNRRICRYWYRRILLLSMFIFCVTYMGYLGMVPNLK